MDLSKVFSFQKNSPATENEINFSENNILGDLPEVYKQFLRETNGMVLIYVCYTIRIVLLKCTR